MKRLVGSKYRYKGFLGFLIGAGLGLLGASYLRKKMMPKIEMPPPTPPPPPEPPVITEAEMEPLYEDIARYRKKLSRPRSIITGDLTPYGKGVLG